MRSKGSNRGLKVSYLVAFGILLVATVLLGAKLAKEQFRQEVKTALNNSHTVIQLNHVNHITRSVMEEEIAIYNKEQEKNPEIQYIAYKLDKDEYVLISELTFFSTLAKLKVDMLGAIRKMADYRGEERYEFTFWYATEEQKAWYDLVIEQFGGVKEEFNFQEVRREGEEATTVIISFENPFVGMSNDVPTFFLLKLS